MPASGKSTLGVMAAKALGWNFIDTDVFIQAHEGQRLKEIIETQGVEVFRALETQYVHELNVTNFVVATGGSVVFGAEAMHHLQEQGHIVWLQVSLGELQRRIDDLKERGVIHLPGQTLAGILKEREALYRKYAQTTIACDGKSSEELIEELVRALTVEL